MLCVVKLGAFIPVSNREAPVQIGYRRPAGFLQELDTGRNSFNREFELKLEERHRLSFKV